MSTTEVELAEEIQQISELGHLVGWWTAAELIEQAHQRFDQDLDGSEPLSVFQLARLRRLDLTARWLMAQTTEWLTPAQAWFAQMATREQLIAAILGARS